MLSFKILMSSSTALSSEFTLYHHSHLYNILLPLHLFKLCLLLFQGLKEQTEGLAASFWLSLMKIKQEFGMLLTKLMRSKDN